MFSIFYLGVRELPKNLPNARELSLALFSDVESVNKEFTTAVVAWGQVIAHDTSFSNPIPNGENFYVQEKSRNVLRLRDY